MAFLYEYMTEDELAIARESAVFESESAHLDNELKVIFMEHELRLNDIEMNVIVENYTDDDLTALYIKEMETFQESVGEWWDKFKKWFVGVINALLGKTDVTNNGREADEEIEVPVDLDKANSMADKFLQALKKPFNFKKEDGSVDYKKIVGEAAVATILTGGGILLKNPVKMAYSKFAEKINALRGKTDDAKKEIANANITDDKEATLAKEISTQFHRFISFIIGKCGNILKPVTDKVKDTVNKVKVDNDDIKDIISNESTLEMEQITEDDSIFESCTEEDIEDLVNLVDSI